MEKDRLMLDIVQPYGQALFLVSFRLGLKTFFE